VYLLGAVNSPANNAIYEIAIPDLGVESGALPVHDSLGYFQFVPEPTTILLLVLLVGLACRQRMRD
jgi:hypothetical protein